LLWCLSDVHENVTGKQRHVNQATPVTPLPLFRHNWEKAETPYFCLIAATFFSWRGQV
jgi:hypothetical protein